MFKKILVPIDGSEISTYALQQAIKLVKDQHAKLKIIHIVDEQLVFSGEFYVDYSNLENILRKSGLEILNNMAMIAKEENVGAEVKLIELHLLEGRIEEKIMHEAGEWQADLIVIGTHGRRGVNRLMLGSVAENVVRISPIPVLLIPGTKKV